MCTGVEIAAVIGATASAASAIHTMTQKPAKAPDPIAPEKPPQASKAPDVGAIRKNNSTALTGQAAGNASTFLTGPSGITDNMLNLGKNTLLGQ